MKSLTDILQDLVEYCYDNGGTNNPKIQLVIPKAVLERYSLALAAREKIIMKDHHSDQDPNTIRVLYCHNGRVELFNADDNLVVKKD